MKEKRECELCGRYDYLEEHHLIPGRGLRDLSDKYKLTKNLCRRCHNKVHSDKELLIKSKQEGQRKFERTHKREEFIKIFGRNYFDL